MQHMFLYKCKNQHPFLINTRFSYDLKLTKDVLDIINGMALQYFMYFFFPHKVDVFQAVIM